LQFTKKQADRVICLLSATFQIRKFAHNQFMDTTLLLYIVAGGAIIFFFIGWYLRNINKRELEAEALSVKAEAANSPVIPTVSPEIRRLQLQAYERMIILCDRISLTGMLGRMAPHGLSAATYQAQLVQNIKQEFEYNVSQQLYVSEASWDAIKNLKEQNIYIINQIAALLPADATGLDLGKKIAELLSLDENASLQQIVSNLLNKEARQLMKN
jgi:hypothetical protein